MWRPLLNVVVFALAATAGHAAPPAGFTALFNGTDLTGWRGGDTYDHRKLLALPTAERDALVSKWTASLTAQKDGKPHWSVDRGELLNDGLGGYATTERDYGDFELLVDWKITAGTDSGIYLRGVPQIQIWDPAMPDPKGHGAAKGSGGLWNNAKTSPGRDPLVRADKPLGEWNRFRVVMVGSRVSVWLNDQPVVDHVILENFYDKSLPPAQQRPIPARGPVQLQTHGGETRWRNLFIREIGPAESTRLLAARGAEGLTPAPRAEADAAGVDVPSVEVVRVEGDAERRRGVAPRARREGRSHGARAAVHTRPQLDGELLAVQRARERNLDGLPAAERRARADVVRAFGAGNAAAVRDRAFVDVFATHDSRIGIESFKTDGPGNAVFGGT
jgi:hypothetical protein